MSEFSVSKKVSLGQKLEEHGGVGPGFDHARIGLSLSILLWHSFSNSYGLTYAASLPSFPIPPLLSALLPMFFGLSGFLVMGSALRTQNVKMFLAFRTLRILPALFTEVTVSALLIGPMLTTLPLSKYFTEPTFFEYFGSLFGRVRYSLPGVFADNPTPYYVNFALWTVAPEILCYIAMTALMVTGYFRDRHKVLIIATIYVVICVATTLLQPADHVGEVLPGRILIFAFLLGALAFLYRHQIPYSGAIGALSFALATALIFTSQQLGVEAFSYFSIPLYVYCVVAIGLTPLPPMPFFNSGDYSYGIYIYGFPIQQAIAHFLPSSREWWVNFGIALPITLIVATASWHMVEKPFLNFRSRFKKVSNSEVQQPSLWMAALGSYAFALVYMNNIFPLRDAAKAMLRWIGGWQQ